MKRLVFRTFLELKTFSEENTMSRLSGQRFPLDSELLNKILNSMDTEYDRMALKAVIFALHSRSQLRQRSQFSAFPKF